MSNQHNYPLIGQAFLGSKPLSASATLTGTDSGKGFSNAPATAAITVSLPKSKPGLTYQFLEVVAHNITVTPVTGDTIRGLSTSASYVLNAVGQLLVLECITPGFWEVVNIPGSPGGIIVGGVSSVTGTANQTTATPTTGAVVLSLPQNVIIPTPTAGVALTVNGQAGASSALLVSTPSDGQITANALVGGQFATLSFTVALAVKTQVYWDNSTTALNINTAAGGGSVLITSPGGVRIAAATAGTPCLTAVSTTTSTMIQTQNVGTGSALAQHMSLSNFNDADFNVWVTQVGATSKSCQIGPTVPIPIVFLGTGLVGSGATGGGQGVGTGNFTGVFVNGVAVGNPITSNHVSTAVPFASTTALAVVPQLTTASLAAGTYAFEAVLLVSEVTSSAGGIKFDFGAGSASVTPFAATGINVISNTYAPGTVIPITTVSIVAANPSIFIIKGTTTLTSAGTFGMRAAQNTSSANTTSIAVGSYIKLTKIT